MPDISKLTMPNGIEYNIKDSQARKDIEKIKKSGSGSSGSSGLPDASEYKDGTALIAIDGEFVPAEGYGYLGEEKEFHWDGKYHADEFEVINMNSDGDDSGSRMYLKKISDNFIESDFIILSFYTSPEDDGSDQVNFEKQTYDNVYNVYGSDDFGVLIVYNFEEFREDTGIALTNNGSFIFFFKESDFPNDGDYAMGDLEDIYDIRCSWVEGAIKLDKNLYDASKVSFSPSQWNGIQIGTLTIDNQDYTIYTPNISFTRNQTSGTKIGTLKTGYSSYDLYAPSISVSAYLTSGTQIATINGTQIYAPSVSVNRNLTSGTQIATINGTQIYAPSVPVITSGIEEYEDGVTSLANGSIYLQYEV